IFKPNLKLNIERKSILNFALPLLPHVIGVFFITVFDRFILGLNLGLESVGFYMVAFQLMSALGMVSDAFNKFFSPVQMRLLEQGSEESLQKLAKYIYVWVAFILSSALISVVIFNFYIENFLSAQYIESKSILPWLAMGHCFN
ncbi:oligosaccharide flippase family protein, partial [Vibrio parahaemolyticus]|nr:oligosaccharide flippase family protein [Vibrio parahaemolyticus]